MRKTKIICTLGPAVDSEEMVRALIRGGMNAARFNFSHGDHPSHLERLNRLKAIRMVVCPRIPQRFSHIVLADFFHQANDHRSPSFSQVM